MARTGRPGAWTKCCGSRRASMRVLYFGTYDRAYPRNAQVISALRGAGVEVREQHRAVWERRHNWSVGLRQMLRVAEAEHSLRRTRDDERDADALIVGLSGALRPPRREARRRGRPVIFNPLVSLFDTLVDDRQRFRRGSPGAGVVHIVDRRAFRRADRRGRRHRCPCRVLPRGVRPPGRPGRGVFVGAEDRLFRPGWQPEAPFHALFVGKLIPLHGLETILAAAALAPEIPFRVVGSGQLQHLLDDRPSERRLGAVGRLRQLPNEIQAAGCALGIFGTTAKAARVIPNKAFQAIACATPLITADTPAARELLADGRDALLVPPGDPAALAAAVRRLADDAALAETVGAAGRATYEARASEAALGARWRALLERAIAST